MPTVIVWLNWLLSLDSLKRAASSTHALIVRKSTLLTVPLLSLAFAVRRMLLATATLPGSREDWEYQRRKVLDELGKYNVASAHM